MADINLSSLADILFRDFSADNSGIKKKKVIPQNVNIPITPGNIYGFGNPTLNLPTQPQPSLDPNTKLNDIDVMGFGAIPSASSDNLKKSLIPDQSLEQNLVREDNINNRIAGLGEVGSSNMGGKGQGGDPKAGIGGIGVGDIGAGADKKEELEANIEANKAVIADERRMQQGQLGQDQEEAPKSKFQQNQDSLQALFTSAMDEQKQLFGDLADDTGEKSIEDYKAQFQKATGIDVSGEPDNKMALMSLGLSLMQNKAGKGFNLSNILTSVGEAGEAAMPAFQKAKDDARAGQVAAGKYALQQTQADEKTKLALAKEKRLSLSALSKEFRTTAEGRFLNNESHLNKMEQNELAQSIKIRAAMIKAGGDANKVNKSFTVEPIDGQGLKYRKAVKVNIGGKSSSVFVEPAADLGRFKDAAFNISRARSTLKDISGLAGQLLQPGVVPIMSQVSDNIKSLGVAFGLKPESLFPKQVISDGKGGFRTVEGVSKEALSKTLRDKIIVEYKRFLTQETGNGISNKDVEMVNKLIGKIDFFSNPKDAIEKINQVDSIFQKTENQINNVFKAFRDEDSYGSEYQYKKAMSILDGDEDGKTYTFGNSGKSFNVRSGKDGRMIYSLKKK